jgi:hypothetical protein
VRLICAAGGVAVLAHPGVSTRDAPVTAQLVDALVAVGLAGIEVDHPGHDPDTATHWRALAGGLGLCATGASDYHGGHKAVSIGAASTPDVVVERLRARAQAAGGGSARVKLTSPRA